MAKLEDVEVRGKYLAERYNKATLTHALHQAIKHGDNEERLALRVAIKLRTLLSKTNK